MKKVACSLCLLMAATLLVACSSSQADWNQASTQNTVAAYQTFLNKHPNDQHAATARQRIESLQDNEAWTTAQTTNTVDSYQKYLTDHPNGAHVQDAHNRIMGFEEASAWQAAKTQGTAAAIQDFLQKYPSGPDSQAAHDLLAQYTYQVELGRFSSSAAANRAQESLQKRYGKDLQSVVVVPPSGKSHVYRVASAEMTQDQAKAACAMLKKAHQRCEVTKR